MLCVLSIALNGIMSQASTTDVFLVEISILFVACCELISKEKNIEENNFFNKIEEQEGKSKNKKVNKNLKADKKETSLNKKEEENNKKVKLKQSTYF